MTGAQQARHVPNDGLVAPGRRQSQFNRVSHILGPHVPLSCMLRIPCRAVVAEFPGDDIAAVIVQDCAETIPAPANDLEVGEVGLPLARQGLFTGPRGAFR